MFVCLELRRHLQAQATAGQENQTAQIQRKPVSHRTSEDKNSCIEAFPVALLRPSHA